MVGKACSIKEVIKDLICTSCMGQTGLIEHLNSLLPRNLFITCTRQVAYIFPAVGVK